VTISCSALRPRPGRLRRSTPKTGVCAGPRLNAVAERCSASVEQFAAFSRAEPDQAPIFESERPHRGGRVAIRALLGDGVELELQLTASDADVRLAPEHVEQILLSTLRNANQAMPHGGTLRIETASVELAGATPATRAHFCALRALDDNGHGASAWTRARAGTLSSPSSRRRPAGIGTGSASHDRRIVDRARRCRDAGEPGRARARASSSTCRAPTGFTSTAPQSPEEEESSRPVLDRDRRRGRRRSTDDRRGPPAQRRRCEVVVAASGIEALELLGKLTSG